MSDCYGSYRYINDLPPFFRPQGCEYFTDDEVEYLWASSRDEELGEMILGDED